MRYLHVPLACLAGMLAALADPTPVNIAVISTPDTADLGALVTTELSSSQQVRLLERDDLAKIGDEAKVQQMAGSDSIALGKLVGADGLFFIDKEGGTLRIRFTAVSLGYALFDDQLGADLGLPQQAKAIAHRIADYAPKLRLDPTKAVPLSVINLRADTNNADTVALERPLTLLLESRLSFVPEYVVLERRHAWSLGFEHALDASGKPLLHGAYLIDGTISRDNTGDNCTVHLRLRDPHSGQEKTANIAGATGDPASLANKILAEVENDIPHASPAPTSFDTAREADDYLHEALWGWRSNVPDSALEAVDSAELLGASDYTVVPMRVNILCAVADQGMEKYDPRRKDMPAPDFTTSSLDSRVDTIERAIDEVARYRDEKMEAHLQGFVPDNSTERFFFRTGELLPKVSWIASKLLLMLEDEKSPRADELRLHMRKATGYDPLHGKDGVMVANSGFDGITADDFADDWAQNLDEELAWYRLAFVDSNPRPPRHLGGDPATNFCARFLTTPGARHKAWNDFVASLKNNPKSQRIALVLATQNPNSATADQAYRDYLNYLLARVNWLGTTETFDPVFNDNWRLPDDVVTRNITASLPVLHAVLNTPRPGQWSLDTVRFLWRPQQFSPQEAPTLWREFNSYQKRRTDLVVQKDGHPDESFLTEMSNLAAAFRQQYPDIAKQSVPGIDVNPPIDAGLSRLVVSQFWHPWLAPDYPANGTPIMSNYTIGGDDIYICSYRGGSVKGIIFEVHLPDFATRIIPTMDDSFVQNVLWTPQALYTALRSGQILRHELARYDLRTNTWTKHELNFVYLQNEMYTVDETLYLGSAYELSMTDADCGLTKYDWDKDQATSLASSRRRPARNQFDDASPYTINDVFPGPGGKPVMSTPCGAYYIQEKTGTWPLVFNGSFGDATVENGHETLIYNNQNGEITVINRSLPSPVPIMASDIPTYRVIDTLKGHPPPKPTPWADQAIFDCLPGKGKNLAGNLGWHDGHLFIFAQPDKTQDEYEILCYDRTHGRKPVHIPIKFAVAEPTRDELVKHPGEPHLDQLEHPHGIYAPRLCATNRGLCLQLMEGGFWFIPYGDIESYVKTLPAAPTP